MQNNLKRTGEKYGDGSYGLVYQAKSDSNFSAVKCNKIEAAVDFIGSVRELDIINALYGHPHIVGTKAIYFVNPFTEEIPEPEPIQKTKYRIDQLFFVQEPAVENLLMLISNRNTTFDKYKEVLLHILLALEFMHSKGIIHHDIKPGNILIFENNQAKLCDFGLSIPLCEQEYNKNVITIWYRAPEVCLIKKYDFKADIWSVGCIALEMITKLPSLYLIDDNNKKLLDGIVENIPSPDIESLKGRSDKKPKYKNFTEMLKITGKKIEEFNRTAGSFEDFLELVSKMLTVNPENRFTAAEALDHKFFDSKREYIKETRSKYIKEENTDEKITIHNCLRRQYAVNELFTFYNSREKCYFQKDRQNENWYTNRTVFHALALFDLHLNTLAEIYKSPLTEKEIEETTNSFYICLYISIKYFNLLCIPVTFSTLTKDRYKAYYKENQTFERRFIRDILGRRIYRTTIYEATGRALSELEIYQLLKRYGLCESVKDIGVGELSQKLMQEKDEGIMKIITVEENGK